MVTLTETEVLTRVRRLNAERLSICVTEAWVKPRRSERGPAFDETDIARLSLIVELTEDMAVNDEAVPVILDLLDEVSTLRRRMKALDSALSGLEPKLREAVLARIREVR
ncbi:chaperone modulator CbpM [Martelella endophytica]|uniref:chaperone modulator CbpM n=1 Tax=Martelella endophytica TaxID=1486262 RepID=UPI000695E6B4|nr:chaperone modulator CbpM [Martelella endophytica]